MEIADITQKEMSSKAFLRLTGKALLDNIALSKDTVADETNIPSQYS